jgi:hypothetical protein
MDTEKKVNSDPETGKLVETTTDTEKTTKDESPAYEGEKSNSAGKAFSSCILYIFCSVSMVLVNKSLASR